MAGPRSLPCWHQRTSAGASAAAGSGLPRGPRRSRLLKAERSLAQRWSTSRWPVRNTRMPPAGSRRWIWHTYGAGQHAASGVAICSPIQTPGLGNLSGLWIKRVV